MSLFHRLIVGHFDLATFVAHQPVPLRSLDPARIHDMLGAIGTQVSETQYDVDGEPLYFQDGYCDCPWLSSRTNTKSEQFARTVAESENCYLIERGIGTILHPVRSIQRSPGTDRQSAPSSASEAAAWLEADESAVLHGAVVAAAGCDESWVEPFCLTLTAHRDSHVRGNAVFALGKLAHRKVLLTRETVQPAIERAFDDPHAYVAGLAIVAAKAAERHLQWVISAFDNGLPEMVVGTYANGWVKCPNCGWRFATYSEASFREGRHLRCRQRLRVTGAE